MRVLLACLALCLAVAADEQNPYSQLLDQVSPSIVTIKAVQKISFSGQEQESKLEMRGVVVDTSGLVMVSASSLNQSTLRRLLSRRRGGSDIQVSTTEIQVVFENEEKEYAATLVASDSDLDLAFVRIDDLEGRSLSAIDFSQSADIGIGFEYYTVSRLGKAYDFAPYFLRGQVTGYVKKPRKLYATAGESEPGLPAFSLDGKLLGVPIIVLASEDGDATDLGAALRGGGQNLLGILLLPASKVDTVVKQALEQASTLGSQSQE